MPRLLVVDNYDSFTYNLVQYLAELGAELEVVRNDAAPLSDLLSRPVDGLVISPGPGRPEGAGLSLECARAFGERGSPVLGVCLGHQVIGQMFGGRVVGARAIMHGKTSQIHHDGRALFADAANPLVATRYHSLAMEEGSLPAEIIVSARSEDGEVMGLRHKTLPIEGLQFHPESILTGEGKRLLGNFLALMRRGSA